MGDLASPLRVRYGAEVDGLQVVSQAPPTNAGSFSATYVGPAGWGFDRPGFEGAARLVNQIVTSAAGRYDRVELARRLDRAGATVSHECSPESAEVTIWGPAADWEDLLGILAEVVLRPRFDPEDVARARRQFRERQLRETSQPASRADRELLRSVFPERHPYRATGLGNGPSLGRLSRSHLVRFHREQYTSEGSLLVVTAGARPGRIDEAARRLFSDLPQKAPSTLRLPEVPTGATRTRRIDLPGRSQVEVRVGGLSVPRNDAAYPAVFLANEVLGGRPLLSRLFQRVRERGGLAYHASSDVESMRFGGYWVAQAGTGADRWRKVVPMLEQELGRLRQEEVPLRELRVIRESAIGEIPLSLETTAEAHELAVEAAYFHLPEDHWIDWPRRLRAVRPREMREASERGFGLSSSATIVAGPLGAG